MLKVVVGVAVVVLVAVVILVLITITAVEMGSGCCCMGDSDCWPFLTYLIHPYSTLLFFHTLSERCKVSGNAPLYQQCKPPLHEMEMWSQ